MLRHIDHYVLKSSRGMDEPSTLRSGWYCWIRRDSSRWSSFWPTNALSCLCILLSNAVVEWVMILLRSRWRIVILNVFKTSISAVSFLPVFLIYVHGVFKNPVAAPAYRLLGLSRSLRLRFISENASLLALYICSTTHGLTSLSC